MRRSPNDAHRADATGERMPRPARWLTLALLVVAALVVGCGSSGDDASRSGAGDGLVVKDGHQHVHGLGVNPTDGDLYIATHNGLWRARTGQTKAKRVGDLQHDLMGFTVVGPDRFLASGHPALRDDLPPQLGLQRSTNAGETWDTVSLLGAADLHVLRAAQSRVYGVDSGTGAFVTSADGGRTWQQRTPPAAVVDLAIAPRDSTRVVAATRAGLLSSNDTGRTWRPLRRGLTGLLAWPKAAALYLVAADGVVWRSTDGGRDFDRVGFVGTEPEAFAANGQRELYAAVHGGTVLVSTDGGAHWQTRSTP
jgi:hypothetical protein